MMENALEYANPRLVVFDVSSVWKNLRVQNVSATHKNLDMFPLSKTKMRAINDLFTPVEYAPEEFALEDKKNEFIFDFLLYHNRWTELNRGDFAPTYRPGKGGAFLTGVDNESSFELYPADYMVEEENVSHEYLRRVIESCREKNIDILLTYLPTPLNEEFQMNLNYVYKIAEEYDVKYINFVHQEPLVNSSTDYHDMSSKGGHLNPSGARKVTSYLGNYLVENYGLEDHRQDERYSQWHEDYAEYTQFKFDVMNNCEKLDEYCSMLPDRNIDVYIYAKKNSDAIKDGKIRKCLSNVAFLGDTPLLYEITKKDDYFMVVDQSTQTVHEVKNVTEPVELETPVNTVFFETDEAGLPALYLNGESENLFAGDWKTIKSSPDLQIVVVDHFTKEVVSNTAWKQGKRIGFKKSQNVLLDSSAFGDEN